MTSLLRPLSAGLALTVALLAGCSTDDPGSDDGSDDDAADARSFDVNDAPPDSAAMTSADPDGTAAGRSVAGGLARPVLSPGCTAKTTMAGHPAWIFFARP